MNNILFKELIIKVADDERIQALHINYSRGNKRHIPGWTITVIRKDKNKNYHFTIDDFLEFIK